MINIYTWIPYHIIVYSVSFIWNWPRLFSGKWPLINHFIRYKTMSHARIMSCLMYPLSFWIFWEKLKYIIKFPIILWDHFVCAPSQWETTLYHKMIPALRCCMLVKLTPRKTRIPTLPTIKHMAAVDLVTLGPRPSAAMILILFCSE